MSKNLTRCEQQRMQILARQISSAILPVEKIIAEFRRNFKFDFCASKSLTKNFILTRAIFFATIFE